MPSRRLCTPSVYVPTDRDLLAIVRRRPGASLRVVCGLVWPDLPWTGGTGADSACTRVRLWQRPFGEGCGNRTDETTASLWLRDRLQGLVEAGVLTHAPRVRTEVDLLASLAFIEIGAELPRPAPDALTEYAHGRREVSHG